MVKLTQTMDYYIINDCSKVDACYTKMSHFGSRRQLMNAEIGILRENRYIRDFLKHYHIQYQEFSTAQEMLASDVPVLFCDKKIDLLQAVKMEKFVLTNHNVLMQTIGKEATKDRGYYYVMKDFGLGERSFYITEPVYRCDSSMGDVCEALQRFVKEQDFFDVGETFSSENAKLTGACILAGRQIISLPWDLSGLDRYQGIALRPYYKKRSNRHSLRILPDVDHKGFRQLLLALLRYAYRRQGIWMPDCHAVNVRMGEQDIEFIYPPEKLIGRAKRLINCYDKMLSLLPGLIITILLLTMLYFTSVAFATVILALATVMAIAACFFRKKAPNKMKYLFGIFAAVVIIFNLLYNIRSLSGLIPLYRTTTQSRYQSAFMERGEYVDAMLQLLAKGRIVQVHDTGDAYEHPVYTYYEEGDPIIKYAVAHDPKYYYGRDYYRFFEEFADEVTVDDTLVAKENFDFSVLQNSESMTNVGYSNDMMRYAFLINQDEIEQSSYFWYDYVYREQSKTMYVYMENELPSNCTTLVALWDLENNLYIMSRDYYDREVSER